MYKETPKPTADKKRKDKEKKRKKKEKKRKKKKSRHHSISSADEEELSITSFITPKSCWSVACLTLQDWEKLTEKYKSSKAKTDRELFETLSESFLPEIVKMFAEKEREERRRMLMLQPKRASSRIERKRKEQEDRDREMAIKVNSGLMMSMFPNSSFTAKKVACSSTGLHITKLVTKPERTSIDKNGNYTCCHYRVTIN